MNEEDKRKSELEQRLSELKRTYERRSEELADDCVLRGLPPEEAIKELVGIRMEKKKLAELMDEENERTDMSEEDRKICELELEYERKSRILAHDCMLRGLTIEDVRFWEGMKELSRIMKEKKELEARMGRNQEVNE